MATVVPAFLSQAVYDRLTPTMDGFGKMNENLDRATYRSAKEAAFALFARDGVHWLADHLEYLRNIAGEDGIGIGSDFYGGPNPPGLEDCSRFPAIFVELEKRGWSERAMEKLARRNFERVWRATYKAAPVL